jgi:hypothetical protein
MTDILLPTWLRQARVSFSYMDSTGVSVAPYTGIKQTASFGGDRMAASLEFTATGGAGTDGRMEHGALIAFLMSLRGKQNRVYLYNPSFRRRGSFSASEVISNNSFESGTTGFTASANAGITVNDRLLRLTRTGAAGAVGFATGSLTVTQYAPYVLRAAISRIHGPQDSFGIYLGTASGSGQYASASVTTPGVHAVVGVPYATSAVASFYENEASGPIAGNFTEFPWVSLTRCALVDNGANLLLQSDALNTTWTATRSSVSANTGATADPIGTNTADSIVEDNTAGNSHFISQSVTVSSAANLDYCLTGAFKSGARSAVELRMYETNTGGNAAVGIFNLSTGAVHSTSVSGGNWANPRSFIKSLGNGWYQCSVVARKVATATTIVNYVMLNSPAGTAGYNGDNSSNIYGWRVTLSQSGVPARLSLTTTTATTGTAQTGNSLNLKGLTASTAGLLLPGDAFEVITSRGSEFKIATSPLDSSADGLGTVQFEPPLRGSVANNAAVIVEQPMMRAIFTGDMPQWSSEPGIFTTASAEFEEVA